MIWIPKKTPIIVTPKRRVHPVRPGFFNWFGDKIAWNGDKFATECCYRQARKCSDDSLADVWVFCPVADDFPNAFQIGGTGDCYYFGSDAPSASPGTTYPAADLTARTGCDDAACGTSEGTCGCATSCSIARVTFIGPGWEVLTGSWDLTEELSCTQWSFGDFLTDPVSVEIDSEGEGGNFRLFYLAFDSDGEPIAEALFLNQNDKTDCPEGWAWTDGTNSITIACIGS